MYGTYGLFIFSTVAIVDRDGTLNTAVGYTRRISAHITSQVEVMLGLKTAEELEKALNPEEVIEPPENVKIATSRLNLGRKLLKKSLSTWPVSSSRRPSSWTRRMQRPMPSWAPYTKIWDKLITHWSTIRRRWKRPLRTNARQGDFNPVRLAGDNHHRVYGPWFPNLTTSFCQDYNMNIRVLHRHPSDDASRSSFSC